MSQIYTYRSTTLHETYPQILELTVMSISCFQSSPIVYFTHSMVHIVPCSEAGPKQRCSSPEQYQHLLWYYHYRSTGPCSGAGTQGLLISRKGMHY